LIPFVAGLIRREVHGVSGAPTSVDGGWTDGTPECTDSEMKVYLERFRLGSKYGKDCDGFTEEKLTEDKWYQPWELNLQYDHPQYPDDLALYMYPLEDHNGAFSLCEINEEGEFERLMCKRLLAVSERYSVKMVRVSNTVDAKMEIEGIERRIHRLVLGGHGRFHKLAWGDDSENDGSPAALDYINLPATTESFLKAAQSKLADNAVVFCDSCQGGKCKLDEMNFVQFVAWRLAGVEVCGSQNLLEPHMLDFFRDETARPRLAVHNHQGLQRGSCAQFPRGMDHWKYDYATTCAANKEDYVTTRIPCNKAGNGPRAGMLCEANQLDECRRICTSDRECIAFVFYTKLKNNCQIMKRCDPVPKRHASIFWRPKYLDADDVAFAPMDEDDDGDVMMQ